MIHRGWHQILDLLFPRACMLCRRLVVDTRSPALCVHCRDEFSPIEAGCLRCGAPERYHELSLRGVGVGTGQGKDPELGSRRVQVGCGFCKSLRWDFGRAWCYTVYQSTAARAVRLMKESQCESLTCSIGDLLCEWLGGQEDFSPVSYDCIVPIPQHWFRRLTQRYNQALTLGERMSSGLKIPCSDAILRRRRWTQKQGMKTIIERRENLLDAFDVPKPESVRFRSFLLIDDVMTSGATLQAAASALKRAGARRVDAVVFARGINASKPARIPETNRSLEARLEIEHNSSDRLDAPSEALRRKIH